MPEVDELEFQALQVHIWLLFDEDIDPVAVSEESLLCLSRWRELECELLRHLLDIDKDRRFQASTLPVHFSRNLILGD